jgi:Mg-chelatase subunit ChlD
VLVLDRSGSMRNGSPPKIEVATQAVARLAVAAERLGIRVAIIDFIDGQARLEAVHRRVASRPNDAARY